MSPRVITCTLLIAGLLVLAGCSPNPTPAADLTTVGETVPYQLNNYEQAEGDPMLFPLPSSTPFGGSIPPNTAAPITGDQATAPVLPDAQPLPVSAPAGTLIQTFEASSATEAKPGGSVMLSWRTAGNGVTLRMLRADTQIINAWEGLAQQGSITINVPPTERNSVGFLLTTEADGVTESAVVAIELGCGDAWYFSPSPDVCPAQPPITWAGVAQPFEHGLMIYIPANAAFPTNVIYVLYDDGTMAALSDTWQDGMPVEDAGITAPAGFFEPTRSFGLVWSDPSVTGMDIRRKLGWATGEEVQYEAKYQCDSTPVNQVCYLQGPSGLLVIEPMSIGWHVWWGESVR